MALTMTTQQKAADTLYNFLNEKLHVDIKHNKSKDIALHVDKDRGPITFTCEVRQK